MAWSEVASGGLMELNNIGGLGGLVAPGQRAEFRLELRWPAPEWALQNLADQLAENGVSLTSPVRQDGSTVTIPFINPASQPSGYSLAWIWVVIAIIIVGTLALFLVSWAMLVYVAEKLGPLGVLALAGIGVVGAAIVLPKVMEARHG